MYSLYLSYIEPYLPLAAFVIGVLAVVYVVYDINFKKPKPKIGQKYPEFNFRALWVNAYQYDDKLFSAEAYNKIKELSERKSKGKGKIKIQFEAGIPHFLTGGGEYEYDTEFQSSSQILANEMQTEILEFLREQPGISQYLCDSSLMIERCLEDYDELLKKLGNNFPLSRSALPEDIIYQERANIRNMNICKLHAFIKDQYKREGVIFFIIEHCSFRIVGMSDNRYGLLELYDRESNTTIVIKMPEHSLTTRGISWLNEHAGEESMPLIIFGKLMTNNVIDADRIIIESLLVTE